MSSGHGADSARWARDRADGRDETRPGRLSRPRIAASAGAQSTIPSADRLRGHRVEMRARDGRHGGDIRRMLATMTQASSHGRSEAWGGEGRRGGVPGTEARGRGVREREAGGRGVGEREARERDAGETERRSIRSISTHSVRRVRHGDAHAPAAVPRAAYPPGQRDRLRAAAAETLAELPRVLRQLGTAGRACQAQKLDPWTLPGPSGRQPAHARPATVRVVDDDTINAAVDLLRRRSSTPSSSPAAPPLIVNFASARHPGGGWRNGALAQEEALCYRSSLALSLDRDLYPLGLEEVLYTPYVLVIRADLASGHALLADPVARLPVLGCVTVAALQRPPLHMEAVHDGHGGPERRGGAPDDDGHRISADADADARAHSVDPPPPCSSRPPSPRPSEPMVIDVDTDHVDPHRTDASSSAEMPAPMPPTRSTRPVFALLSDRFVTKLKMRLVLRAAACHGHDQLVLGALGCGVYANPPEEVARCWLEVLREPEFAPRPSGAGDADADAPRHWWRDVVFAVYEGRRSPSGQVDLGRESGGGSSANQRCNFDVFHDVLDGQQV